jgi:N-acetyl-D-muramate 6-phosphate phosphatase
MKDNLMAVDFQRIKAICFDVDGTLSDTDDLWVSKLSAVLRPFAILFPQRDPAVFARRAVMVSESPANLFYHLLDRFDLDDEMMHLYHYVSRFKMGRRSDSYWLISGIKEMLQQLQPYYKMAVVSARDDSTFVFLEQHDLLSYFSAVAISNTCRYTKPYPDPILWAAREMGAAPQEILMVGDTSVDIRAGRAAGAQTAAVLCGFGEEKELRRAGADLILSSTADLLGVLQQAVSINEQPVKESMKK